MNDYKVFYKRPGEGDGHWDIVTEMSEDKAWKSFKNRHKGDGSEITEVTLIQEDTTATKEQEREALAIIRRMVMDLGPTSYLRTAFAGCFEDAESNIENDFGDSMKARWQYTETQLDAAKAEIKVLKDELAESKKDYEAAHAANHALADEKDAEIAVLQARTLSADDLAEIAQMIADRALEYGTDAAKAAERIVDAAENPESAEFQNAVIAHRAVKANLNHYSALLSRVNTAKNAVVEMGGADNA